MAEVSESFKQRKAKYHAALAEAVRCARSCEAYVFVDASPLASSSTQSGPIDKGDLGEAISRLSQHVDVAGLNPRQAKRIAHRRAQKAVAHHLAHSSRDDENRRTQCQASVSTA